jgi:hypothetical protein
VAALAVAPQRHRRGLLADRRSARPRPSRRASR